MPLIPFPLPPATDTYIDFNVRLVKGARTRWYWVERLRPRPPEPQAFKGFIKFDGFSHRALTTTSLQEIMRFRIQCEDEIREHEIDGWVLVESPWEPRGRRR